MKLADFNYQFPPELVAQRPLPERDASRMMIVDRAAQSFRHSSIAQWPEELREGDLLIVNDSKVIPARLFGKRSTGESLEVLVVEPVQGTGGGERGNIWRCLLKKAKRIRPGEKFFFGMQATATVRGHEGIFLLLDFAGNALELAMKHHGVPPLPPYIERDGRAAYTDEDRDRYQTTYAAKPGSAAAPTAGLHLSDRLLERIRARGVAIAPVTLHVGIDTFAPVRVDDLSQHQMHGERFEVSEATAAAIAAAKKEGRRVIAVGTTSVRALESAARSASGSGTVAAGAWTTDLFITPGYAFQVVDAILTNFHQPKSTLLMLVSAFAGHDFIFRCYAAAMADKYRLFSYGDCMFIV